jgi:succinate dehydrogenase hydrophobic anchor subunit
MTEGGFTTIDGMPDPKKIIKFIIQLLPTATTFIIVILYFVLNAVYRERIDGHNVATEYKSYATLSSILVFIQTALVGIGLWKIFTPTEEENHFKKVNKLLLILILFIINLYLCGISNVILKYFSTDG